LKRRVVGIVLQALAVVWLGATLYPFLWLLLLSFKTQLQAFASPPVWVFTPTFENYGALAEQNFFRFFRNSALVAVGAMTISLALGVPAAYALSRLRFRGRRPLLLWVLMLRMVPGMAYVIPYFMIYQRLGMLDTPIALIILYTPFNLALVIWTMDAFFAKFPRDLEESAVIDGASTLQAFRRIVLPLSGPGLIATAILCFLFSWNEFLFALVITRSEAMTLPVAVTGFLAYQGAEWGKIAAATMVLLVPVLVFAFSVRRYMVGGVLAGSLKGE
jgi:multiple sugar transport system permease protein